MMELQHRRAASFSSVRLFVELTMNKQVVLLHKITYLKSIRSAFLSRGVSMSRLTQVSRQQAVPVAWSWLIFGGTFVPGRCIR